MRLIEGKFTSISSSLPAIYQHFKQKPSFFTYSDVFLPFKVKYWWFFSNLAISFLRLLLY
jgi:hypothetical protein